MYEVLILLAAYKGNKYIDQQIKSILHQDCDNWHLILSDDGDDTTEKLEYYAKTYPSKITHYKSGKTFGSPQGHFYHLLSHFSEASHYFMLSDQDDVWNSDKISITYKAMKVAETQYGELVPLAIHTDVEVVDENLLTLNMTKNNGIVHYSDWYTLSHELVYNDITGCTLMLNEHLVNLLNRSIPLDDVGIHDWWIGILASAFGKVVFLDVETMKYRQHAYNVVGAKSSRSIKAFALRVSQRKDYNRLSEMIARSHVLQEYYSDLLDASQVYMLRDVSQLMILKKYERIKIYKKYGLLKESMSGRLLQYLFW